MRYFRSLLVLTCLFTMASLFADEVITVESPPGSGNIEPLDQTIVATTEPTITVTLPTGISATRDLLVLLVDADAGTVDDDLSALFSDLIATGTATASIQTGLDTYTLRVYPSGVTGAVYEARFLCFEEGVLHVARGGDTTGGGPSTKSAGTDPFALVTDEAGNVYQEGTILVNFPDGVGLDHPSETSINDILRAYDLSPIGYTVPTKVVFATTNGIDARSMASALTAEPVVTAGVPNYLAELDDVAGERMPQNLLASYRSEAGPDCDTGTGVHGCFDSLGPSSFLRTYRYHFMLDLFAAHRLVEVAHAGAGLPTPEAGLAILDTGLGNGTIPPTGTNAFPDIPVPDLFGYSSVPWNFDDSGTQVNAGGVPVGYDLTDVGEVAYGTTPAPDHGTRVASVAAGRGTATMASGGLTGTGPHLRVRPMRLEAVSVVDVQAAIIAAAMDVDVDVLNLSLSLPPDTGIVDLVTEALERTRQPFVDDGVANGVWDPGETFADRNGNGILDEGDSLLVVCSAGNQGMLADRVPAALAPSSARQPDDVLLMTVSGTATRDDVDTADEGLYRNSSFGNWTSVSAPGHQVASLERLGRLRFSNGTSFASPMVAGLAGEMIYFDQGLVAGGFFSPRQIVEIIEATAENLGSSLSPGTVKTFRPNDTPGNGPWDQYFGHGRINAWKAMLSVANRGVADASGFPSLSALERRDAETEWYGFEITTSVKGATVWIDGAQVLETDAILPDPSGFSFSTTTALNAYAGVTSDHPVRMGVDGEDPTLGIVPIGNGGSQFTTTFSITRDALIRGDGRPAVLSLRLPGEDGADPAFFSLRLDLRAMRAGRVPGVSFDDFVFEITPVDFGDAFDAVGSARAYPTLLGNSGARHLNTSLEWFGLPDTPNSASVSAEANASNDETDYDIADPDGQVNIGLTSNGITMIPLDRDGFDDGIIFLPIDYSKDQKGRVRFWICTGEDPVASERYAFHDLWVNAWVDWNTDNDWDQSEQIIDGFFTNPTDGWPSSFAEITPIDIGSDGRCARFEAVFTVPEIGTGLVWSRFRLDYGENAGRFDPSTGKRPFVSSPELDGPRGPAWYGEVQDYLLGTDFGDAQDPFIMPGLYPTLFETDGAYHLDIHREWLGFTRRKVTPTEGGVGLFASSVTREADACDLGSDQDSEPNLGISCDEGDKDAPIYDNGLILPGNIEPGQTFQFVVRVHSTISVYGFDHARTGDYRTGPGACGEETVTVTTLTPSESSGMGRYNPFDPKKRLWLNIWADWNGDGEWSPFEQVAAGPVDPSSFGKDGRYTLGEPFVDVNGNGSYESDVDTWTAALHDIAGINTREFRCEATAPDYIASDFYFRIRLDYGEDVLLDDTVPHHANIDDRYLDETRGGALWGEVEDYRLTRVEKRVYPKRAPVGGTLRYTLEVPANEALTSQAIGWIEDDLPESVDYAGNLTVSHGRADYDPGTHRVWWQGALHPDTTATVAFDVVVRSPLPAVVHNICPVFDGFRQWQVGAVAEVIDWQIVANTSSVLAGEDVHFRLELPAAPTLTGPGTARLSFQLPPELVLAGVPIASHPGLQIQGNELVWEGPLGAEETLTVDVDTHTDGAALPDLVTVSATFFDGHETHLVNTQIEITDEP